MINIKEATKGLTNEEIRNHVNSVTMKIFSGRTSKMAKYTGKQSVLDEALGDYKDEGFQLIEPDDHVLELWFKDKRIAVYNQPMATFEIIREGCHNFLVNTSDPATIAKKLEQDYQDTYGEELRRSG